MTDSYWWASLIRFQRVDTVRERTRYRVWIDPPNDRPPWSPGTVASFLGTSGKVSGAYWQAFVNGNSFQVLRHSDVATKPPISFPSRARATNALVLHVLEHHPDLYQLAAVP